MEGSLLWADLAKSKIKRPPNAFILFSNDQRKIISSQYPGESNNAISKKLGEVWKNLSMEIKNIYKLKANDYDKAHKLLFPDYVYSPSEARIRKKYKENKLKFKKVSPKPRKIRNVPDICIIESKLYKDVTVTHNHYKEVLQDRCQNIKTPNGIFENNNDIRPNICGVKDKNSNCNILQKDSSIDFLFDRANRSRGINEEMNLSDSDIVLNTTYTFHKFNISYIKSNEDDIVEV